MNDEQYFLANAYLDGELTDDERHIAETDPEVMAEVEQLRALQAELRAAPPPSTTAREAAIGAALAEFSGGRTATTPPPRTDAPPATIPLRPRPAYAKYLGIAAAVVAVAGLGIIVSRADLGGDDDDAATADVAETQIAEGTAERGAPTGSSDSLDDPADDAAGAATDADGADAGDETATAMVVEEEAADALTAEMGDEMAASAADADISSAQTTVTAQRWVVGPDFDPDAPILDERDLGIFGVHLLDERDGERLRPSPNTRCDVDDEILDIATVVVDGVPTRAYIGVSETDGRVLARDTGTCAVILAGSIFVR